MPTSNAKKQQASDWTLQADLDKKLQFSDIVQMVLRPAIVIQSTATKRLVIVELTVPWEERCQSAYELKKAKYTDLQTLYKERGWQTWLFPVEVGCRGFPAQSVWTTLTTISCGCAECCFKHSVCVIFMNIEIKPQYVLFAKELL